MIFSKAGALLWQVIHDTKAEASFGGSISGKTPVIRDVARLGLCSQGERVGYRPEPHPSDYEESRRDH